jgi:hypothetical protein
MKRDAYIKLGILIILTFLAIGLSCMRVGAEGFEDAGYKIPTMTLASIPVVKDVWVINLDKSKDRWNLMIDETKKLDPLPINRWSATDGRVMTNQDYIDEKIPIIVRPDEITENRKERRKGEIGCYLSHKKLLEYLGKQKITDTSGHLILEDDVTIDKETLSKWKSAAGNLNKDWDICFFGIHDPVLGDVSGGIAPVKSIQSLHSYMVRHGSIPKILEVIKVMYDPIDEMIRWNADKLKLYAVQPFLIKQRANFHSDIQNKIT